ncbi:MAG: hypothetical protein R6V05_02660 [Candidatus Brocadiia bacterium]
MDRSAEELVGDLDSFDPRRRRQALEALVALHPPQQTPHRRPEVNVHVHTFYSYNAYGYSPSRFAWEAHRYGLEVAGIVDFDVLDGTEEFLEAGRLLRLKTVSGFETRVFVPELEGLVTNSPHEPGVAYLISTGFVQPPRPGTTAAETLAQMAECAQRRNRRMVRRVNEHLEPVTVDYEQDVLPLTPAGNATERHMLVAYDRKAREMFPDAGDLAQFWSEKLEEPPGAVRELLDEPVELKALIRARLMKYGGVGYAAPEEGSFPQMDDVLRMILDCGAVPSGGWLDGTHEGERDPAELFGLWRRKGIPFITIVPDRNWNLDDPEEKALKVAKLHEALDTAVEMQFPLLVGTEMNKHGRKFVDTFSAPELEPYRQVFLDGAHTAWGHTLLMMTAGVGYTTDWAEDQFGEDLGARNEFFRRVGAAAYPDEAVLSRLERRGPEARPDELVAAVES